MLYEQQFTMDHYTHVVPSLPGESPLEIELMYTTTIISPGQDLTVYCRVNCTAILGWTFNGGSLPVNAQVSETSGLSTRLTVTNGNKKSAGVYTCLAQSATEAYSGISSVQIEFYGEIHSVVAELNFVQYSLFKDSGYSLLYGQKVGTHQNVKLSIGHLSSCFLFQTCLH